MSGVPDVRMGNWGAISLVAGREVTIRLKSKAFQVTTAVTLLLLVGFSLVMKFTSGDGADATVGFTGASAALEAPLKNSAGAVGQDIATRTVADEAEGRRLIEDGSLDALLVGDGSKIIVVVEKEIDSSLESVVNVLAGQLALNRQITQLGGDPAQVAQEVSGATAEVRPLEAPFDYDGQQLVIGMLAGILIYMSLLINGQSVAQGVVEEKSSRVVELLLATIRPWQLMVGKVVGIGAIGLLQMVLIGGVGLGAALGLGVLDVSLSTAVGTVVWLVVWYLLGFIAYSLVFAALGALVSRQEDVGGVIMPPLMFVILGYVLGISILPNDPGNQLVEVLSVVPLFAPTLMPMRLAMGGVPAWEAGLAVVLMLALIPGLVWLSGRIYRNAVMRSGAKVKLRDALRAS
ncbi:putative ABC iron siderophore transporter, fused permease and ATPase domain [Actinokineospora spheciospongiae]|uniref:Putative ABC iron siderophore transporter, fused permease and ATPase domain n=1 Tax=Actinokineospora spheciospongiae TaxID=909613 RepID=W7ITM0_9PSEU|nr:ABC transporter permease [Actinokineospora spheciospongiae]EWC60082.1 putative ABC iron siderophore transporter, fused permease and ATPase domain [Actinokineospora spheciospongiae]